RTVELLYLRGGDERPERPQPQYPQDGGDAQLRSVAAAAVLPLRSVPPRRGDLLGALVGVTGAMIRRIGPLRPLRPMSLTICHAPRTTLRFPAPGLPDHWGGAAAVRPLRRALHAPGRDAGGRAGRAGAAGNGAGPCR